MKPKKSDKGVSDMDVLKDIRGLLSVTREQEDAPAVRVKDTGESEPEIIKLKNQVEDCRETIQKQQEELSLIKREKEELVAKLKELSPGNNNAASSTANTGALNEEAFQLEARIAELSTTLNQVDELLNIRAQELSRKIARIFQEAGQGEISLEFRKATNALESVENYTHFLEVLLGQ